MMTTPLIYITSYPHETLQTQKNKSKDHMTQTKIPPLTPNQIIPRPTQ